MIEPYVKKIFVNDSAPPISAENLSYMEDGIEANSKNVVNLDGATNGYSFGNYSLPSGSSVGQFWNNDYITSIPSGSDIKIKFLGYSGTRFVRLVIYGIKLDNSTTTLTTIYSNSETEYKTKTVEIYKGIRTQLVRSEAESPVSYSVTFKCDIGEMLGHDILSLQTTTSQNTSDIAFEKSNFDLLVNSHLNLFDIGTFTDGYIYNSSGVKVATAGMSVTTPIRVKAGVPVYLKYARPYFSYFIYDDGTNSGRLVNDDTIRYGSFTPSKDGYAYLSVTTTQKDVCVCTLDSALYNSADRTATYYTANKLEGIQHIYKVEKDGSGDFTSLVDAIDEAEKYFDSIVYVGAGTWDIIDELGAAYIQAVDSSKRGIVLKNRIHLIFSSNSLVKCEYEGIGGVIKDDTVSWLSVFNAGEYGFTLENCKISSKNIRYCVHDERGNTTEEAYINRYINCTMTHNNQKYDPNQGTHGYGQCIGGGLGKDGYIEITGCVFENTYQYSADVQGRKVLVSYHTNNKTGVTGRSQIEITGCYFKDAGTCRGTYITTNTAVSTMLVHDNSFGKEPFVGPETQSSETVNIEMIKWNNELRES